MSLVRLAYKTGVKIATCLRLCSRRDPSYANQIDTSLREFKANFKPSSIILDVGAGRGKIGELAADLPRANVVTSAR